MAWLTTLLITVLAISAIAVIVLVLLQHGKGADMGAAFGGGASGSLFGATGSANFLSRSTAVAATVFFVATLGLAFTGTSQRTPGQAPGGLMQGVGQEAPAPGKAETPATAPIPGAAPGPAAPTGVIPTAPQSAPPPAQGKAGEIPTK
ncbi:MAG: preprotein translocase subunit SecG [Burkholderiales bacterium]|jgi:preprotein translocase subunit SecG|nr:preprotein translocase subunit SecG [Burkholderiales bacterium]MCA3230218.1 preprotein translocase subunit SecG [Burkholderiales bacterium]